MEEWQDVLGWEGVYQVSNRGRVKRIKPARGTRPGRILSTSYKNAYGYPVCVLRDGDRREACLVHRLVAAVFIGPCPEGHEVNHANGVRDDNRPENLEYVTRAENNQNILDRGVPVGAASPDYDVKGSNNPASKLTEPKVKWLRKEHAAGRSLDYLAERCGVTKEAVWQAVNYITWKHVD